MIYNLIITVIIIVSMLWFAVAILGAAASILNKEVLGIESFEVPNDEALVIIICSTVLLCCSVIALDYIWC